MYTLTHPTPVAPLSVIVDDDHTVLAAGFCAPADLAGRMRLDATPPLRSGGPVDQAVTAYLAGDPRALDDVPVRQAGTDFQQGVWQALRTVPPGQTRSYGQLAAQIDRPGATRAVGSACGRNLVAPFVPCHRAVRADGSPGGYAYGLAVKRWLLNHETGQGGADEARAPTAQDAV